MDKSILPIGVFDSGVGGISVLKELVKVLPEEHFIYFCDSANAPYGTKSHEKIFELTEKNIEYLIKKGVKAIVVACNTATSVCIDDLRRKYSDIPVVGIEPALKPAVKSRINPTVLVMATPLTLRERKFAKLCESYSEEANIIPLPCPGLVELIEQGCLDGEKVEEFLAETFKRIDGVKIDSVVLGCTHYPFVKNTVKKLLKNVEFFDGGLGTAKQLKRCLEKQNTLNTESHEGKVEFENSLHSKKIIELSYRLLNENIWI